MLQFTSELLIYVFDLFDKYLYKFKLRSNGVEVTTIFFLLYYDRHLSETDYHKRKNVGHGIDSIHQLLIGWMDECKLQLIVRKWSLRN